jgi:hypothetical protein
MQKILVPAIDRYGCLWTYNTIVLVCQLKTQMADSVGFESGPIRSHAFSWKVSHVGYIRLMQNLAPSEGRNTAHACCCCGVARVS